MLSNNSFEFSKGSKREFFKTSNESLKNKKEDRILNKEYTDPYRNERKYAYVGLDDIKYHKYTLNTLPTEENLYQRNLNYVYNNNYNAETRPKQEDTTDITSELKYYKHMIEKMHNEIGNLNNKLFEIEKNNYNIRCGEDRNLIQNKNNSMLENSTTNLSTAHFRKEEEIKKHISFLDNPIKDQSLISNIKKLENDKSELSAKSYLSEKKYKTQNEKTTKRISRKNSKSNSKLNTQPNRNDSKNNSVSKISNKSTTSKSNRSITKKTYGLGLKRKENEVDLNRLHRENEELKIKLNKLEQSLKAINSENTLDKLEKKGKDYLRVELEIWKNRSEAISKSYLETISNLKKQIFNDKNHFIEQIKTMQNTCNKEIGELKNKYQFNFEKLEAYNKNLKIENLELKKKVSKVKEILTPSLR
jgi:hypothetical protein